MGLLQGETISFGHRQRYPGGFHLLDCSQQCCDHTACPSAVLERLILAHQIFNGAAIADNDEVVCVYLLGLLLCCSGLSYSFGHDPLLSQRVWATRPPSIYYTSFEDKKEMDHIDQGVRPRTA